MKLFRLLGKLLWWIVKSIIGFVVMNVIITILVIILIWKFVLPHTPDGYQPSVSEIQKAYQTFSDLSSGKTQLTNEQMIKIAPLNMKLAPDLAYALNIIDPKTFSNIPYWTALLTKFIPFYSRLLPSIE